VQIYITVEVIHTRLFWIVKYTKSEYQLGRNMVWQGETNIGIFE